MGNMNIRTEVCAGDVAVRDALAEHGTVTNYDFNLARQQIKACTTAGTLRHNPDRFEENFRTAVEGFEIPVDLHEPLKDCVSKIIMGKCFAGQPRRQETVVVLNDRS